MASETRGGLAFPWVVFAAGLPVPGNATWHIWLLPVNMRRNHLMRNDPVF